MNCPPDFHLYCGPRAIAALLGRSPHSAAAALWHCQTSRGRIMAPAASSADILLTLAAHGCRITEYGTSRAASLAELKGHDELVAELLAEFRRDIAAPPRNDPPPPPAPPAIEQRLAVCAQAAEARELLTLAEFVYMAPLGRWYVAVGATATSGLTRHAIALQDGRAIAGDGPELSTYGQASMQGAWRIEPPTREE